VSTIAEDILQNSLQIYFRTLSGSLTLFYSISETTVNGDGTPVGLRLATAMGLPLS
jgi:hypothetical protein